MKTDYFKWIYKKNQSFIKLKQISQENDHDENQIKSNHPCLKMFIL